MNAWAYYHKVDHIFIKLGKPMQNGYIENFNGKFRSECLDQQWFRTCLKLKKSLKTGGLNITLIKPHISLENLTSAEYTLMISGDS